jgi:hypothetical protein
LAALFALAFATREGKTSESDRIWNRAFGHQKVMLCGGSLNTEPVSDSHPQGQHSYVGFSFTTARTAVVIGSAIGHAAGSVFLLPAQDAKFEDLQRTPVVLIGAFSNEWLDAFCDRHEPTEPHEFLKQFSKSAPSGWEKRNYEIVLASDLVNNLAAPSKL